MSDNGNNTIAAPEANGPQSFGALVSRALDKVLSLLSAAPAAQPPSSQLPPTVWVDTGDEGSSSVGRIMVSWPQNVSAAEAITKLPGVFIAPGLPGSGVSMFKGGAANDNTFWVGDEDFDGIGGALGRDPTVAVLADGHTVVAWISEDNIVHASVYPPETSRIVRQATDMASAGLPAPQRLTLSDQAAAARQNSRLSITPSDGSGFLVLWASEFGFTAALIAKASLDPTDSADAAETQHSEGWHTISLPNPPASLEHAETVTISQSNGSFEIAYADAASGEAAPETYSVPVEQPPAENHANQPSGPADATGNVHHNAGSGTTAAIAEEAADTAAVTNSVQAPVVQPAGPPQAPSTEALPETTDAPAADTLALLPADPLVPADFVEAPVAVESAGEPLPSAADPVPAAEPQDAPVAISTTAVKPVLSITPVAANTAKLTLTTPASSGGAPVVITEKALISDVNHPHLDLAPSVVNVADQVAVTWVEQSENLVTTQLNIAVVTPPQSAGEAPAIVTATVTVASEPEATISDLSLAVTDAPGVQPDIAILWVSGASAEGYGQITAQFAEIVTHGHSAPAETPAETGPATESVPSDAAPADTAANEPVSNEPAPVEEASTDNPAPAPAAPEDIEIVFLGQDCTEDGSDEPFVLGEGRDPEAVGLPGEGALAVAWIAPPTEDTGPSIKGAVLSLDTGSVLDNLDLSDRGQGNIEDVQITADDSGDIFLGWLQDAIGGGFDAMVALFMRAADKDWKEPTIKQLKHFAEKPLELTLVVEDGPNIDVSLALTWTENGGKYSTPAITVTADVPDGSAVSVQIGVDDSITALPAPDIPDSKSGPGSNSGKGDRDHSGSSDSEHDSHSGSGSSDKGGLKLVLEVTSAPGLSVVPVADEPQPVLTVDSGAPPVAEPAGISASSEPVIVAAAEPPALAAIPDCNSVPASLDPEANSTVVAIDPVAIAPPAPASDNSNCGSGGPGGGSQGQSSDTAPVVANVDDDHGGPQDEGHGDGSDDDGCVIVDLSNDTIRIATATFEAPDLHAARDEEHLKSGSSDGHDRHDGSHHGKDHTDQISSHDHDDDEREDHSGSGKHGDHNDDDTLVTDNFVFAAGYGHDAAVPDLVLNESGHLVFGDEEAPLGLAFAFDFDMPLSEDFFIFDHDGQASLQHLNWNSDLLI